MINGIKETRATLNLFSAVCYDENDSCNQDILSECIYHGFIVLNSKGNVVKKLPRVILEGIKSCYGQLSVRFNNSFYKDFDKVVKMPEMERLVDQIMHYFSTYGREALGLFAVPYIPSSDVKIEKIAYTNPRGIKIIKALSKDEMIETINNFAKTITKPSTVMVENFKDLISYFSIPVNEIASFEFKMLKHENDGTVPTNGDEFLRYVIYTLTGSTLLIKSDDVIKQIRTIGDCGRAYDPRSRSGKVKDIFSKADEKELAAVFLRHKKLFLALKKIDGLAPTINRLRRLANKYHKPLVNDVLNFSNLIKSGNFDRVKEVIDRSSNENLIKLLSFVKKKSDSVTDLDVYNIRNGKTFVKNIEGSNNNKFTPQLIYPYVENMILDRLTQNLSPILNGKSFYIPSYIEYTVPVSSKQMINSIPYGSFIELDDYKPVSIGIHWTEEDIRTDLDLHMNGVNEHFGWNSSYCKSNENEDTIVYSGDMTSAAGEYGASEAFFFKPKEDKTYLLSINKFSGPNKAEFEIFMSHTQLEKNGVFDPNTALFPAIKSRIDSGSQNLGVFHDRRFYFYGGSLTSGIVPSGIYGDFIKGSIKNLNASVKFTELLERCGATVIRDNDMVTDETIDLSPSALTTTTLIDILKA